MFGLAGRREGRRLTPRQSGCLLHCRARESACAPKQTLMRDGLNTCRLRGHAFHYERPPIRRDILGYSLCKKYWKQFRWRYYKADLAIKIRKVLVWHAIA